jgi:hypothetical protein
MEAVKELTPTEAAIIDLEKGREAMARLAQKLGKSDPAVDEIPDWVMRSIGTAVRFEVDVTTPLADLKRELNTIRAEMTNCLATLDSGQEINTRRHQVHMRLSGLRAHLKYERDERKNQKKAQTSQTK